MQVELTIGNHPADDERNDALAELAAAAGVGVIATSNVHYAAPQDARLAQALAAIRARSSLDDMDGWLAAAGGGFLRSGAEMTARLQRYPGVMARTVELAAECSFDFHVIAPRLPDFPVPDRHAEESWLRELTARKAPERYGPRGRERVPGAYAQIDRELEVIGELGFPGYFLIVHEIVEFCENEHILCQGRGSAANSAVCYALGITSVDPVQHGLLFERFLSVGPGRPARHRPGHRASAPRGGHPVRLRDVRPPERRAGRERDQLPAADGDPGRGPRARVLARAAGRVVQAGGAALVRARPAGAARRRGAGGGRGDWPSGCRSCRGTWASTPAAW